MYVGGRQREEREREEGERQREREGVRERTSGLSQSVRFFPPLILFHVMGLVLRRRNGTEKNTLLLLLLLPVPQVLAVAVSKRGYPHLSLPR